MTEWSTVGCHLAQSFILQLKIANIRYACIYVCKSVLRVLEGLTLGSWEWLPLDMDTMKASLLHERLFFFLEKRWQISAIANLGWWLCRCSLFSNLLVCAKFLHKGRTQESPSQWQNLGEIEGRSHFSWGERVVTVQPFVGEQQVPGSLLTIRVTYLFIWNDKYLTFRFCRSFPGCIYILSQR